MKSISYVWTGKGSLVDALFKPFDRLAIWLDVIQRPIAVRLCHKHERDTLIQSCAHTIARQMELGVLEFSKNERPFDDELTVKVADSFGTIVTIEKLVIEERDVCADAGIAFKNVRNEEIVIVSGVQPYGLAIKVPWESQLPAFEPQYALDEYQRISMGTPRTE